MSDKLFPYSVTIDGAINTPIFDGNISSPRSYGTLIMHNHTQEDIFNASSFYFNIMFCSAAHDLTRSVRRAGTVPAFP